MAWAAKFFGGIWAKIALIGAGIAAVLLYLRSVKESGRKEERAEHNDRILKDVNKAGKADRNLRTGGRAKRVRDRFQRD